MYKSTNLQIYKSTNLQMYKSTMMLFSVHVITILFGTNNKEEDDENQERVGDRNTYWEESSPSEQEEVEETTSVPSRDSRPQRDYSVPEVDGVTHQEVTFSTTSP
jgi:hypothetical protein